MKSINSTISKLIPIFLLIIISLLCHTANAAVITVPGDYSTIQTAIDAAIDGDRITVMPGTYRENINFQGKIILLRSTDPTSSSIVASTVISGDTDGDGYGDGTVVTFSGAESSNCILSGFTITDGFASIGAGIFGDGTLATIQNNVIYDNLAYDYGGGLHRCNGTIQNNTISMNSAEWGGGLYGCDGTIQNNTVSENYAYYEGGGLYGCDGSSIQNNTISGNHADYKGGGLASCGGTIQNNIISDNSAWSGGGLYNCTFTIRNNTISANSADYFGGGLYSCFATIKYNTISGNSASYWGGGLYDCNGTVWNNIISGNSADIGGGLYACNGIIQNNIISANSARLGGGLRACDGTIQNNTIWGNAGQYGGLYGCKGYIRNCIIWLNSSQLYDCATPSFSCIQNWTGGGIRNISSDPLLVDPGNGDFHLQPNSPCIDAGRYIDGLIEDFEDDLRPYDGTSEPRGDGSDFDIGADEFSGTAPTPTPSPTPTATPSPTPMPPTPIVITVPGDYSTIQAAINGAWYGDEIIVSPGTYVECITFDQKNIVLRSTDPTDPSVVANTIIDGNRAGGVVRFSGTEYETCVLSGFTITGGFTNIGGGILGNGTLATIQNNIISGNNVYSWSASSGAGIASCNGTIQNNVISDNSAMAGVSQGGIGGGLSRCNGIIQHNIISNNQTDYRGGGLFYCRGTIQNNTITYNSADDGGALFGCDGTIQNNIISFNSAKTGGGLHSCQGAILNNTIFGNSASYASGPGLYDCDGTIRNCIIWQNISGAGRQLDYCTGPSYCCIQYWTAGGTGNISSDPQLVDPANGDFHLQSTSPCIDAGGTVSGLTEDFEGDPRPMDGTSEPRGDGSDFDIGADEFPGKLQNYTFDVTNEGWTAVTIAAFTPPDFHYMPGQILLTAQDNTNTFGYWSSEADAIPVAANSLYRIKWTMATNVTDSLKVPQVRLRVNSQNLQQADMLVITSSGDGSYAPIPEGWTTYEMYFVPPESCLGKPEDQDDLVLSFDILNFDPGDAASGSLMLDSVVVEAIPLSTLETPTLLQTWSFDTDAEGWQFGSTLVFTAPVSDSSNGALWLTAQNNTNTFGYWSGPSQEVQAEAGKLYRLRFTVSTEVAAQDDVPQLRLRVSSEDFQSSIVKAISSVTGAEMSPTPAGQSYDLYFYPPQSLVGTDADSILVAFDILNFDPSDAATGALLLDTVTVESLDVP